MVANSEIELLSDDEASAVWAMQDCLVFPSILGLPMTFLGLSRDLEKTGRGLVPEVAGVEKDDRSSKHNLGIARAHLGAPGLLLDDRHPSSTGSVRRFNRVW
jgi:hypothetical protein